MPKRLERHKRHYNSTKLAYLDDTYILSAPNRALAAYNDVTTTLRNHTGIEPNLGKTVCWNKAGLEPLGITTLGDGVWKGNEPAVTNGVRLLGAPIGQPEYIENFGIARITDFATLRDNALKVDALQYAWLLTYYCVVPRVNHLLRQVPPDLVETTAQRHDTFTLDTLQQLLGTTELDEKTQLQAKLPRYDKQV